ncbi:MAG: ABC transporter permease [Planctomycetota bacterium]
MSDAVLCRLSWFKLACSVGGGAVLLFIIAPLIAMLLAGSGADLWTAATDAEVARSIWLTLWTSLAGTLLLAIPAIPFSWLLARAKFRGKRLVLSIIDLPVVIPHSAAGIALLSVMNRDSLVGSIGESLGISFVSSHWGIMAAMTFVSLPFLMGAAREGFSAVPMQFEEAARTLGASPARVFFTISLPLAWRAVVTGIIQMFARGLSEFGAVVIIAYHPMITPVLVFDRFNTFGLRYARPVAVIFIAICLVVFIGLRVFLVGRREDQT